MTPIIRPFAIVLLLVALPHFARAQANDTEQARQRFQRGLAHYNLREYKDAITDFEAAYRLHPDPVFLYNLGQCHRLLGNDAEALYFYRAYLRSQPDAPNRSEVEDRIAKLQVAAASHPQPSTPPVAVHPPPTPTSAALAPSAAPTSAANALERSGAERPRKPLYKKWWFWTAVGVAVAGAATGLAVGLTVERSPNSYPQVNF